MANPTELPPTSGPASMSALMTAINSWLTAGKASWADGSNPPGMIDGLVQYFTPSGSQPRLRFRRVGAWAGILDDIGRETSNLNNAIEGGTRYFNSDTPNAPFNTTGSAIVIPGYNGVTQIATRRSGTETDLAYIRVSLDSAGTSWTPWRRIFTQADIVGSVTRSGGIPTGAVIESAELSSGFYERLADGSQTCRTTRTLTYEDVNVVTGLWTFPRAFVNNEYTVSLTLRFIATAPGVSMLCAPRIGDTSTSTQLRIALNRIDGKTNFISSNYAEVDVVVHGRWAS